MIWKWSIKVDICIYYNKLMTKYDLKNKLRLQLSDDMREFAIVNNLTEQDVIKIRDDNLIPQPHLGYLTALLKDKNFEFYKEDK